MLIGGVLLHEIDEDTGAPYIMGVSVLVTFGGALYNQISFTVSQAKVKLHDVGAATSFLGFAQIFGATTALVISNCIFLNQATDKIQAVLPDASRQDIVNAVGGSGSAFLDSLSPELRHAAIVQIVHTLRQIFVMVKSPAL